MCYFSTVLIVSEKSNIFKLSKYLKIHIFWGVTMHHSGETWIFSKTTMRTKISKANVYRK